MKNKSISKVILLIFFISLPVIFLAVVLVGLIVGFGLTSVTSVASSRPDLNEEEIEREVLFIAADYAANQELPAAQQRLQTLDLLNSKQYISFMVDRYNQENRGPEDGDTHNLFMLAEAMGVG